VAKTKGVINTILLLLFLLHPEYINSQILKDSVTVNLIKRDIDCIYNGKNREAEALTKKVQQAFPGHPVVYLLKGMKIYWENYPLLPTSPARASFEESLRRCLELSDKKQNHDEAEYLLANLCSRGFLLLFYTDNNLNLEVFPLVSGTYQRIMAAFKYTSVSSDFYYFTGIFNYYREVYPEVYPVYKPLAILFPRGSRIEGVKQLREAARNSIMLKGEALIFLSEVFANYESNFEQAIFYSRVLHELYPGNMAYEEEYIKNLLLTKQYDKAEKIILAHGELISNSFFNGEYTVFKGILSEKKYNDYKKAKELYTEGAKELSLFGNYGKEFSSFAYYGLSRISYGENDKHFGKLYRKKGDELADFKKNNFD